MGKPFRKKSDPNNKKTVKTSEIAAYEQKTYPADCRKIAAVDSHNSIGIERKENINKN